MKQTFRVVLEVEVDADAYTGGVKNGNPGRWNWQAINKLVDIADLTVRVEDYYVACCESKIDWYNSDLNVNGYEFEGWEHDSDCKNYVADDYESDDEDTESEASLAFQSLFGNVNEALNNLTVRPTSPSEAL